MAVSVTPNLTDVTLGLDSGDWANTDGTDIEIFIQGTGSESWYVGKNTTPTATFDAYSANGNLAHNMSASDTHLYFWVFSTVALLNATKTNSGLVMRIIDGSSNWKEWKIAGSDTWDGRWTCFVQDINATADASSGTLVYTDIQTITFYVNASGTTYRSAPANYWIDAIRFGTGLTATGTTFNLSDIASDDELTANKYGVLQDIDGVIFSQGRITVGAGATTTTMTSDGEVFVFKDTAVSSGLYQLNFVGSGNTSVVKNGYYQSDSITSRFKLDASDTDITYTQSGMTIAKAGLISYASGDSITTSVYNNCLQITPDTATFQNNTLSNYIGTEGGSLLWPTSGNVSDCTFINCDNGVEISQSTNQTFSGMIFDDEAGNYDVNATGTSAIEVAKTSGSNPNSYNTGGQIVTFTASYDFTVIGLELNTEVTVVTAGTNTELYHVEDATISDGDGKYKITYTHGGGASVDIFIHEKSYKPDISNIYGLTLPNLDSEAKVKMFVDLNYYNP